MSALEQTGFRFDGLFSRFDGETFDGETPEPVPLFASLEDGVVVLRDAKGCMRMAMSQRAYIAFSRQGEQTMIRPIGNNVVLRRDAADKMTAGGLLIPDAAADKEKVYTGTVVAVGRGRITESGRLIEPEIKSGDRVVFEKYSQGQEIEIGDEKLIVIRGENVVAVLG